MDEPTTSSNSLPNIDEIECKKILLHGTPVISLTFDDVERLCLAQISNTLLKDYSYNEIHNRRVALGITCVQCTPLQLEVLRRAGAMPVSSRRCGMITRREAERLVKSFLNEITPPELPNDFVFHVYHKCGWGCLGLFIPSRYNSSRAKCIRCCHCNTVFSPNKFIFHCHKLPDSTYTHPDAANFNSWRRHLKLSSKEKTKETEYAWEDVKALFNGGSRKRVFTNSTSEDSDGLEPMRKLPTSNSSAIGMHGTSMPAVPLSLNPFFRSQMPPFRFWPNPSPAEILQNRLLMPAGNWGKDFTNPLCSSLSQYRPTILSMAQQAQEHASTAADDNITKLVRRPWTDEKVSCTPSSLAGNSTVPQDIYDNSESLTLERGSLMRMTGLNPSMGVAERQELAHDAQKMLQAMLRRMDAPLSS